MIEFDCAYCGKRTKHMMDGTYACDNPKCWAYDPTPADKDLDKEAMK